MAALHFITRLTLWYYIIGVTLVCQISAQSDIQEAPKRFKFSPRLVLEEIAMQNVFAHPEFALI